MGTTRTIGNCFRCCHATRKRGNGECVCARYPKWRDIPDMHGHFCGEFEVCPDLGTAISGRVEQDMQEPGYLGHRLRDFFGVFEDDGGGEGE